MHGGLAAYVSRSQSRLERLGAVSFVWFAPSDRRLRDLVVERPRLRSFLSSYVLALVTGTTGGRGSRRCCCFIGYGIS
ncbi:hypothetical protein GCM10017687_27800 [Streptomyces echinatus]